MRISSASAVLILVSVILTGCALPRGGALQSEILERSASGIPQFLVYPVTRDFLPKFEEWPQTGDFDRFGWIEKRQGPIGRNIRPGDKVTISIWDNDENSLLTTAEQRVAQLQVTHVSTVGNIFVPYVGSVKVAGMTERLARESLQEALAVVSPSAQVQLTSTPGRRHMVDLVSGVNAPGSFPLEERDMTILSALSLGGGARHDFKNPHIRLLRGNATYAISLEKLFKSPFLDTTVRNGDKILVVEDERYFLALGASDKEELVTFPKDRVSALDALSLVGGLSATRANPKGILVLREYASRMVKSDGVKAPKHQRVVFTMDLTSADGLFSAGKFFINSQDIVYTTESPINDARTIFALVGSILGLTNQVGGG